MCTIGRIPRCLSSVFRPYRDHFSDAAWPRFPANPKSVIRACPRPSIHDVGRLQIALQHAALMGRGQPGAELPSDLHRFVLRQPPDPSQE